MQPPAPLTREPALTARLIAHIRAKSVGDRDREHAALLLLDAVASVLAGCRTPQGRKVLAWARDCARGDSLQVLDDGRKAFVMGALCHILEMDDLHRTSVVHPGCAVAPVILALAPDRDGRNALTALLHGFEAACRVGMSVGPAHYKIWHNTATCGPFGSAVAASHLLGLDDAQTLNALGNAGSQAAGLWEFLDTGAETKHLHAGRAAEAGLVAAGLADHGLTGAPRILEGPRGFFAATCPDGDPRRLLSDADEPWQAHMTSIKPWPSCRHTHPAIDCALQLHRGLAEHGKAVCELDSIEVETYQAAIALCDRPLPDSIYAAKFSLQHCVAAALHYGHVRFDCFEEQARKEVAELRSKVHLRASGGLEKLYPDHWGSRLSLRYANGHQETCHSKDAKGDPESPLSAADMIAKATELLIFGGVAEPERLIAAIMDMPASGRVPDVWPLISQASQDQE